MAHAPKKTLDDVLKQVNDLCTNLAAELQGLQQNVNTVGQVAAGNSTAVSAGSAKAGLFGGQDPTPIILLGAAAVAGYGMLLRQSPHKADLTWDAVSRLAEQGLGEDKEGYRAEFVDLVRRAQQLGGVMPMGEPRPATRTRRNNF